MHLALTLLAWLVLLAPAAMAAQPRNVLVLYSNNRLLPANVEVDRGLREALATSAERPVELFAEFLDQPTFTGPAYEQATATYLREKYGARPLDVIVVAGPSAFHFALGHRAGLFPGVPVVHVAVDESYMKARQPLPADVVGVPVLYDFAGTIEQALRWHPGTRRLVVVTGTSFIDLRSEAETRAVVARLQPAVAAEFLSGLTSDAVVKRLGALGRGDVVFTPGYFRDGVGRTFSPRESVELIAGASAAPVHGPYGTFIGSGVVGGRMPSYVDMGRQGAQAVNALLAGTPPAGLTLPARMPVLAQVDWRQALKWGIDADAIGADTVVHFRAPTFWEANREQAIAIAAVLLLQAALITALLIQRRLRRQTASALEESEKRMHLAARAASLSTWVWDARRDGAAARVNLRQPADLAKGSAIDFERILQAVHPADREAFTRAVRHAVDAEVELDLEFRTLQPDGSVRWIAARGRVEKAAAGRLTGVALDITARKAAEMQAERDRAALTHMTRVSMLGQLSASIAHQLNQPLAAILGNAEAARKMLDRPQLDLPELKDICDDIVGQNHRAAEVIRRLGALYKRGELALAPLDLNELVTETLELVRTELLTRHVVTVTELAPALPPIDAGRVQLQQVLLNLILNAADAMGTVEPAQRRLIVRTELDGPSARLCVVDHGTGITPEDLRHVFEPFWTTKAGGIGIGLAICQSIVAAHRGRLTAVNNAGAGATFCATLPLRQGA